MQVKDKGGERRRGVGEPAGEMRTKAGLWRKE